MATPRFLCRCWNVGAGSPACTTPALNTRAISLAPCLHREQRVYFNCLQLSGHTPSLGEVRARTWRQEWKQRPPRSAAYWLAPHSMLSLLSYSSQDQPWCHLPCAGPSHINPYQSHRKCIPGLPTGQSGGGIFTVGVSSSHLTL